MKKSLIILLAAVIGAGAFSCSKDLTEEAPLIDMGGSDQGGSSGNPYWDWADKFPGIVSSGIERVFGVQVPVKGGYEPLAFAPDSAVLQRTGLYVASGDQVEIVVPEGTDDLQYQIGIGHQLLSGQLRQRYGNVVTRGSLHSGTNVVSSYFGGFLYFCYPADKVPAGDITVTVGNAVPSDDYVQGETRFGDWINTMLERAALLAAPSEDPDSMAFLNWTELVSDKVILTAGVSEMSAMTDPDGVLDYYGKIADAYYRFGGYDPANQPPMRVYSDIQLPDAGQTALFPAANVQQYGGYPIGFLRGESSTTFVDEKKLINTTLLQAQTDGSTNWFNVFFGFGEAVKSPWQESDKLLQPSLNIGYYHYARTLGIWPGQVINFADNVDKLNKEFARTVSNRDNGIMYGHANDNVRTTMLKQLADYLGWGLFPYVSQRARELGFEYEPDELLEGQAACDFFAMSACEYADRNLLPFFRRWHFPCSTVAIRYMMQFRELGENERFWTSYDSSTEPSFESRTPNKSIARPAPGLTFSMASADDKMNWYLRGVAWDYNAYNDPVNPRCDTVVRANGTKFTGNSIDNPLWKDVFDGNTSNMNGLLGHMQPATGSMWVHIPFYILSFTGPGEDTPEDDDFEYSQEPVTFNTFALWNVANYYYTSYIYDIEYLDDASGEWKPTAPSEFKLLYNSNWEFYYFEREYTTTHIRFKLQPITPGTSGYSITQMCEMGFGLVEEKTE